MTPEEQYSPEILAKMNEEANRIATKITFEACDRLVDAIGKIDEDPILRAVLTIRVFTPKMIEYAAALATTAIEGVISMGINPNNRDAVEEIMIKAVKNGIANARKICEEEIAKESEE